jgi:N-acylglucosamine-6-phosphate 2-epimerase
LQGGIVVSCQAGPDSPLNSPQIIAALAESAQRGGAVGFRVDGPANVSAVRAASALPIIGINKRVHPGYDVFITPTYADAITVVDAGADIIALDGTTRQRPNGENLLAIISQLHAERDVAVMADIATVDDAVHALDAGADAVATTLAGYTSYSTDKNGPALALVEQLASRGARVIVEGRIWTIEDVRDAFAAGAYAIVIGSAITVPEFITRRFVHALSERVR